METTPIPSTLWIPAVAHCLHLRWPHADPQSLEEAALELWRDERWQAMEPAAAAEAWLEPVRLRSPDELVRFATG